MILSLFNSGPIADGMTQTENRDRTFAIIMYAVEIIANGRQNFPIS